ncbi:MAG: anti-phage ZorAB system protein ZorA [Leptospirales bacterium]
MTSSILQEMPYVVGAIISVLIVYYLYGFLIPAVMQRKRLDKITKRLKCLKVESGDETSVDLNEIEKIFQEEAIFEPIWMEYAETLHPDKYEEDDSGSEYVVGRRSTVSSEVFFTHQNVVDIPVNAEFFKHLPGILTGLGIIGTFSGVLSGLMNFQVSDNPIEVRESLQSLLVGLQGAFWTSLVAIVVAIFLTGFEKWLLSSLYKKAETFCQSLDSLYQSGVGEEYLSRLVKASETSATQSSQLKDALVSDLTQILSELGVQQVAAIQNSSQAQVQALSQNSQVISQAVTEVLREPLDKIAAAVNLTSNAQSSGIERMLASVLEAFSTKLDNLFGGQLTGINTLLQQTMQSVETALGKFEDIARSMDSAGQNAVHSMSNELAKIMGSLESRQNALNDEMGKFVSAIQEMIHRSQEESAGKIQSTIALLGEKVFELGEQLSRQSREIAISHEEQQKQLTTQSELAMGNIASHMKEFMDQSLRGNQIISATIEKMEQITRDAIERMNLGAGMLHQASEKFYQSAQGMNVILQDIGNLSNSMKESSQGLTSSVTGTRGILADYHVAQKSFLETMSEMNRMIENAKRDISLNKELLDQINQSASYMKDAQSNVSGFFENVNASLGSFHQEFAEKVKQSLSLGNRAFHDELAQATRYLKDAIGDLSDTLETLPGSERK